MNENILGFIKWAAGIAITLAIISIGFIVFKNSEKSVMSAVADIGEVNTQINESDVVMYDDMEVTGADVIYCIKKFEEDYLGVEVVTGRDTSGTWYGYNVTLASGVATIGSQSTAVMANALDETSAQYINAGGKFVGKVYRDANGSVAGLVFTQK